MNNSTFSETLKNQTTGRKELNAAALSCFLLVNLLALFGNIFMCLAVYRSLALRSITNMFMISLAVTDLLMAVLVMPFSVIAAMGEPWPDRSISCQYYGYVGYSLGGISALTLALVAVNRYVCVARPIMYKNIYTKHNTLAFIASAWVFTAIFLFAIGWVLFKMKFHLHDNVCIPHSPSAYWTLYVVFASIFFTVGPSLAISVSYTKIFCIIRHHRTAVGTSLQQGRSHNQNIREINVTKTFFCVLIAYYVCWLAPFIWHVMLYSGKITTLKYVEANDYAVILPVYLNSAVHPFIYAVMSKQFRREFLRLVCCCR